MNGLKFPREKRSRRPGWTQGPGLVLANGETWHLPTIDEGLIPYLPRLVPSAKHFTEYMAESKECEIGVCDIARKLASTYLNIFEAELLKVQYRTRPNTILDLIRPLADDGLEGSNGDTLGLYLFDFNHFVCNRYPVGFDVASVLATMN